MARIVMADDGIPFDGVSLDRGPLGGAETAFISLAEAFVKRGHEVFARNRCLARLHYKGVEWAPLDDEMPGSADLYIANRGDKLIPLMPHARRTVFWIHNPADYLMKPRYLIKLWRVRPTIVFIGAFHRATYPSWAPKVPCVIIPYGISDVFRHGEKPAVPPPPRAIFTSNPMRGLDWLLGLWTEAISPVVPGAELHVFSGAATYGGHKADEMRAILERARMVRGVTVHEPLPKESLVKELAASRVMLYRGDPGETFCLSVGEAQAVGVPCVVQNIGCVAERVRDGETGFVAEDDAAFARDAITLLTDDALWRQQNEAALDKQRSLTWDAAASEFEKLIH